MKKTKILVLVGIVVVMFLLMGGGIWWWKKEISSPSSSQKSNDNSQKNLADKIKTDLKERIKRVKNGSRDFEDIMPYVYDKKAATCQVKDLDFIKEDEEILSADIGEESFQSIINLNKQIISVRKEWEEKKRQKAQKKADTNPNLFYFPAKGSFVGGILTDEISHFQFDGRQDRKTYKLIIPVLHPDLANILIKSDDWNLYRITGIENIPLLSHPMGHVKNWLYKIVKPENQINIKLIEN